MSNSSWANFPEVLDDSGTYASSDYSSSNNIQKRKKKN